MPSADCRTILHKPIPFPALVLLFALIAVMSGCGGGVRVPECVPVQGWVSYRGKPIAGVRVSYHPQFNIGRVEFIPSGDTGPTGEFTLSTGAAGNGAPAGEYVVTFEKPRIVSDRQNSGIELEVDEWQGRFADPAASAWKVTVDRDRAEPVTFEL